MTPDEYVDYVADLEVTWGKEIDEATADAWWKAGLFGDISLADAQAARMALAATSEWLPTPAAIRRWIARRADAAGEAVWAEVWSELLEERDRPRPWSQAEWSAAVAPFVEHLGQASLRSLSPGSDTPIDVAQAQFRKRWEEWRERLLDHRATDGVPAVRAFLERRALRRLTSGRPELDQAVQRLSEDSALEG